MWPTDSLWAPSSQHDGNQNQEPSVHPPALEPVGTPVIGQPHQPIARGHGTGSHPLAQLQVQNHPNGGQDSQEAGAHLFAPETCCLRGNDSPKGKALAPNSGPLAAAIRSDCPQGSHSSATTCPEA